MIPEIVSIVGMTDKQRADHKIMKLLAPSTKATPTDRASQCFDIIQKINN